MSVVRPTHDETPGRESDVQRREADDARVLAPAVRGGRGWPGRGRKGGRWTDGLGRPPVRG